MSSLETLKKREESLMCRTYARYPLAVKRALGSRIWDFDGKEYIDLLAGIAVTSLGHCHPEVADKIAEQCGKLVHMSNLVYHEAQLDFAERLLSTAHFDKAFFCNSGGEANEALFKIARRYQQRVKKREAYEIITFQGCFHGRTLATVAATANPPYMDGFQPMPDGFKQIVWGDLDALEAAITPKTAGVLLEMVQGEGGVRPATPEFARGVEAACRRHGLLFLADEIQIGLCRSGKWWGFQNFGVRPDVISAAKALANGMPIGAMLCTDEVAQAFEPGVHGTTFGGGPLACATGSAVFDIMKRDKLAERAGELGAWALERFRAVAAACPGKISDVRGLGLLMGIELSTRGKEVHSALLAKGFLCNVAHGAVLRLVPALNIDKADLELFAQALEEALKATD